MSAQIIIGDCRESMRSMPDQSVHTVVTSPPYFGLRDYGHDGQLGLEPTPDEFVAALVEVFREVRRVLRDDGTVWLNLGDSYAGSGKGGNPGGSPHIKQKTNAGSLSVRGVRREGEGLKPKDLIGIPWRVAFALQADGWYLRQDIIWAKPNVMPESVRDRCTKAHEYIFLLTKQPKYYYDHDAIREPCSEVSKKRAGYGWKCDRPSAKAGSDGIDTDKMGSRFVNPKGRNKRSVWFVPARGFKGAHFATFPPDLIEPCVLAGCPEGGTVLDPFGGAGTTAIVANKHGRNAILCELNPEYAAMARKRIEDAQHQQGLFA